MAKRLVLFMLATICVVSFSFAQRHASRSSGNYLNDSTATQLGNYKAPVVKKPARDLVMLQFNYNSWVKKPDSVKTKPLGYSFNGYLCYDFPIKRSKLSFATGLGISTSVVYLNQQVLTSSDTSVTYSSAEHFYSDTVHYKRYKLVSTYLTAPFELRYFSDWNNRNKGFKAAIGLKVGTLLGADAKGVYSVNGTTEKDKVNTKRYYSPWDFAATARVGWGNFSLFASYNLTNVFKVNEGPVITPAAIGICLSGL